MNYVIVDMDGTLSDCEPRRYLAQEGKWDEFNARCYNDDVVWPVLHVVNALRQYLPREHYKVVIFTGRNETVRQDTLDWLSYFNVQYDELRMRPEKDYTPDEELKKSWLDELVDSYDDVLLCIDDRQKVVNMYRDNGITVFQVAPGDF